MELDGIAVTTRKGAESLPLGCPGATLRSSCPASRWPSRAPTAAPCATGGSAERAASANGWDPAPLPSNSASAGPALRQVQPGPEEQHGLLEPGLRILLWTLRGALLLAMALGGWSCYCSGRRRGQPGAGVDLDPPPLEISVGRSQRKRQRDWRGRPC
ncbi:unnamed protein product [Natator depressus]